MCFDRETVMFWAAIIQAAGALIAIPIALIALLISLSSRKTAESSLSQAEQVAARDREEWKQRKWFDLYFQASEFYDHLDRYQQFWAKRAVRNGEDQKGWDQVAFQLRRTHSMAAVFPKTPLIDELFEVTDVFGDEKETVSKERLAKIFDVVDKLRMKAKVNAAILD